MASDNGAIVGLGALLWWKTTFGQMFGMANGSNVGVRKTHMLERTESGGDGLGLLPAMNGGSKE